MCFVANRYNTDVRLPEHSILILQVDTNYPIYDVFYSQLAARFTYYCYYIVWIVLFFGNYIML